MKLAFMIAAVDPTVGGVLAFGDRGTGKSTAVRALAALLPKIRVVVGCPYNCEPEHARRASAAHAATAAKPKSALRGAPVVDLPLGATEDRVVGALNLERALSSGEKHFEPGLLAAGQSRLPLHRRGEPARGSSRRSAARRRRLRRQPGRARGPQHPPSRALRADRQRQPRRGRAAPADARPFRPRRRRQDAAGHARPASRSSSGATPSNATPRRFMKRWAGEEKKLRAQDHRARAPASARDRNAGRGAGTGGAALPGARHRRPARRTDADPRRARLRRAGRRGARSATPN